ncbi:MAG: restriction endonuclease subunit S, partial [Eubacteriales bacterium]|nr:restriction endonuclease subunit S [Eubacteriales bacterium]
MNLKIIRLWLEGFDESKLDGLRCKPSKVRICRSDTEKTKSGFHGECRREKIGQSIKKLAIVWEQRKLGELAERVQKNDGRMDLPTLTISAGSGWLNQEERFSGNIAGNEQKNYTLLRKGELAYNHGNSKLAKYGAVFELRTYEEALVPRVYHSFRMINGHNPTFIEYLFATKLPDRELGKLISSGARMDGLLNIGFDEFFGINLMVPTVTEQERIGEYFTQLDNLITLHQCKPFVLKYETDF